jgi:hypothetical protein
MGRPSDYGHSSNLGRGLARIEVLGEVHPIFEFKVIYNNDNDIGFYYWQIA